MGRVCGYNFDAVIGVGGSYASGGIAGKIVWMGMGPRKAGNPKEPILACKHFTWDLSAVAGAFCFRGQQSTSTSWPMSRLLPECPRGKESQF
jgi:hypothetical protein